MPRAIIFLKSFFKLFDNFLLWYYNNGGIPTKQVGIKQKRPSDKRAEIKTSPVKRIITGDAGKNETVFQNALRRADIDNTRRAKRNAFR